MRALECLGKTLHIIGLHYYDLGACLRQRFRFLRVRIAGQRARGKAAVLVVQDRANQPTTLRARRSQNGDDLLTRVFCVGFRCARRALCARSTSLLRDFFLIRHCCLLCIYQFPCSPITSIARTSLSEA